MQVRLARFPADSIGLKSVIAEYIRWLDLDLSHRGFDEEMAQFDQLFSLPSGLFLMAMEGEEIAGCVGLLRHDDSVAEVKRLYVRPAFRGRQLGQQLIAALFEQARALGFARLILDAAPPTVAAQHLYRALGFSEIDPYYPNATPGTIFFSRAVDEPFGRVA
ncbi:GNAT family N-acetyltransferase [Oxalobacteraceae bacterium]|nr:GNAT family N-acetyltransferase [Oxalobacteraceae bacterium]